MLWTIHDLPAYGLLSGHTTKGYNGCPVCGVNFKGRWSKSLTKIVYTRHRRFLPMDHMFQNMHKSFDGTIETRQPPCYETSSSAQEACKEREIWLANPKRVKGNDPAKQSGWKRLSVFYSLPYWEVCSFLSYFGI